MIMSSTTKKELFRLISVSKERLNPTAYHHPQKTWMNQGRWKNESPKDSNLLVSRSRFKIAKGRLLELISLISTMTKIIGYAQSQSQTPSTSLNKIKRKAGQLFNASEERKQIDELTKELEDILSLISVSTCRV